MSTIMDGFLHQVMYHGLGTLELNLRSAGYDKPMQVNHNSGGMAQLNSTDALQTVHSGPVSGIAASEHLALQAELRSEEHTSELQSLMRISYAVFCLNKNKNTPPNTTTPQKMHHKQRTS